jgi:hypothetical protein
MDFFTPSTIIRGGPEGASTMSARDLATIATSAIAGDNAKAWRQRETESRYNRAQSQQDLIP